MHQPSVTDLARIAFEAYDWMVQRRSIYGTTDSDYERFDDLTDLQRQGWIAAVEAVLRAAHVEELESALIEETTARAIREMGAARG